MPGGCSPCLQNNTECRTTDRITGRATSRGYVEGIEQQNRDLQLRIQELEHQLMRNGGGGKPINGYHDSGSEQYGYGPNGMQQAWSSSNPTYTSPTSTTANNGQQQETNMFRAALPAYRAGCMGDNYLGVSPGSSHLSGIKGTALSILGMEIDIADFQSTDMDEPESLDLPHQPLYNKSYQSFLQSAWNHNPKIERIDLPTRANGFTYAQWYFRVVNPYCPLLHKGIFMRLVCLFNP